MQITITYCVPCHYEARAKEAAEALRHEVGLEAELVGGRGGVFKVDADATTLVARDKIYFPTTEDIVAAVRTHVDASTDTAARATGRSDAS